MYLLDSDSKSNPDVPRDKSRTWNLGEAVKAENKFDDCTAAQKQTIQAAFVQAVKSVNHAAAVLGSAYGRPDQMSAQTRQLLNTHFHTTDRGNVLNIFRNYFKIKRALDEGLRFECETNCGGGSKCGYAWITQWFGGYGDIHLCFDSRLGACSFAKLNPQEQVATIIHEAAHRHIGIDDKVYIWEKPPNSTKDYSKLTAKQAMDNADSYAWFAVQI